MINQFHEKFLQYEMVYDVWNHKYLKMFESAQLPVDHVQNTWTVQQAWLSRSFSHCMGAIFARLPAKYSRQGGKLVEVIALEAWGDGSDAGHPSLFQTMIEGINFSKPEVIPKCIATTSDFVNERQSYLLNTNFFQSLGMLTANEYLNADKDGKNGIMLSYAIGLKELGYGESICAYAQAHVEEEREDVELMLGIFYQLKKDEEYLVLLGLTEEQAEESFFKGCADICDLRIKFFDGLLATVSFDSESMH